MSVMTQMSLKRPDSDKKGAMTAPFYFFLFE